MTPRQKKSLILTAILVLSSFICMFLANGIQSDNGKIRISEGVIRTDAGNVSYKLYKPVSATRDNKAPGVLLLQTGWILLLIGLGILFWRQNQKRIVIQGG